MAGKKKLLELSRVSLHASIAIGGREESNWMETKVGMKGLTLMLDPTTGVYIDFKGTSAFVPGAGIRVAYLKVKPLL